MDALSIETIQEALTYIPADDRETWYKMAMAVKSELGESGFDVWDGWSRVGEGYNQNDARDVWKSVKPHKSGGGVTIGTLIHEAKLRGFRIGAGHKEATPEELAARKAKRDAELKQAAIDEAEAQRKAAEKANAIYEAARPAKFHPYLTKKGIQPCPNIRVGEWPAWDKQAREVVTIPNTLIIPMRGENREIVNLQAVFPSDENPLGRDKTFIYGGRKQGTYMNIGQPGTGVVLVCEGYATAASLHAATGHCVLIAFDAGNLIEVAKMARKRTPDAMIVVCADDDRYHKEPWKKNVGVVKATQAAEVVDGRVVFPSFQDRSSQPTDFNDLAQMEGLDAVREQVQAVIDGAQSRIDSVTDLTAPANDNVPSVERVPDNQAYDIGKVDYYNKLPFFKTNGKPYNIIENFMEILNRCRIRIQYNVISKDIEISIPGEVFGMDNHANAALARLASECERFEFSTSKLQEWICYVADKNQYNPVANWIISKPWDGVPRLQSLYDTITVENEPERKPLKEALMKRWLISAVAAAFRPNGVSAQGLLVLQGPQSMGKTTWFKRLVPDGSGWARDGLMIKPDDKDNVKLVNSFWLVEVGEIDATFRRSDIAQLKAFTTRDCDTIRRPYAKVESTYPRRTVFFGSVNARNYLHDPTGNRRFWTLSCAAINIEHGLDMQQVWAEIYETLYLKKEPWNLTHNELELLNGHNTDFELLDPIRERLQTRYDWDSDRSGWRWMTATEVMLEIGFDRPTRGDVTNCGHILQELSGAPQKRSNGKRLSMVPPKIPPVGSGLLYRGDDDF